MPLIGRLHLETSAEPLPLTEPPAVTGYTLRRLTNGPLRSTSPGIGLNELFQAPSAQGIDVVSLRNKTNRLEELFVRLSGTRTGMSPLEPGARKRSKWPRHHLVLVASREIPASLGAENALIEFCRCVRPTRRARAEYASNSLNLEGRTWHQILADSRVVRAG